MVSALKCCAVFSILLNLVRADDDKYEKYEVFCDKLEMVKGNEILAATQFEIEKTGPTYFVINGGIEHFKEFNDEWTIALKIFKSDTADGEYHSLLEYPFQGQKGICAMLKKEYKKFFYDSIKECSTAPHFDECPLKEAKYNFDKCAFDAGVFKKYLGKGYYIIKVFLSHLEESDLVEYDLHAHVEAA